MYARTERMLTWIALLVALAVAVIAILQIDDRSDEAPPVAVPTAEPSPALEEPTAAPATEEPTAPGPEPTATDAPAATQPAPAEAPPVAAPVQPGASPMPHTGASALPTGLIVVLVACIGALIARHTEARTSARSSTG